MLIYDKLNYIFSDETEKYIFIFNLFLKKINNNSVSHLKNRELHTLRIVREYLQHIDLTLVEDIDTATLVSGNYYQHRHGLYVKWRDISKNHSDIAKLIAMLVCGELNLHNDSCMVELSKGVYVNLGFDTHLRAQIDGLSAFTCICEMWRLYMGYDVKIAKNLCFANIQFELPHMIPSEDTDEVVAYYNELSTDDLEVDKALDILDSWCDKESRINFALLVTQPLYSQVMGEDGLIGSLVAKENMGKSLFTEMLSACYRKVGNFSHKSLTDKGYLFQDLMASIVTNGRDFAVFQETDGISSAAMAALKPLVTHTDKVPARFFSGKTFESSYYGSVILTSNHLNKVDMTSDLRKRVVNIRFRQSTLVKTYAAWLKTPIGATSMLMACLLKRGEMLADEYKTAEQLKRFVTITIVDTVADMSTARLLKSYMDEKGYITGKELGLIFDNPKGAQLNDVLRSYGLVRSRLRAGIVYKVNENDETYRSICKNVTLDASVSKIPLVLYSLDDPNLYHYGTFDPQNPELLIMPLSVEDHKLWSTSVRKFKGSPHVLHIVSETNNQLKRAMSKSFNKIILDYDKFPDGTMFEDVVRTLKEGLGGIWFAVWETASSRFGSLRVRVMVMLAEQTPIEQWGAVVEELDSILCVKSDSSCRVYHKQALIIPWLKWYFNIQPVGWSPKLPTKTELARREEINTMATAPPPSYEQLKEAFVDHVGRMDSQIDEYDFWMRTYLLPLSRYVVYDKSITKEQALELIQLTCDNFGTKMSNVKLLKDAIRRKAGEELFDQYQTSIYEFYSVEHIDHTFDGFTFTDADTKEDFL